MPGSAEQLLQYCKDAGISAIELMGDPAEAFAGSPVGLMPPMNFRPPAANEPAKPRMSGEEFMKAMEERNAKARAWRETASMDKFVELRKMFNEAGITIYAFKPDAALGEKSTDAEIDYAMKAAKALGEGIRGAIAPQASPAPTPAQAAPAPMQQAATAARNAQDAAMGQALGAALQGRRYDNKGNQIKK